MINHLINDPISRHETLLKDMILHTEIPASRIREAMNYSLFPGGKRLRPMLVYLCGHLIGVQDRCLDLIAAAVELTHCYSLIHDDLPAMDNDDFRRGKPSCHRAFDEATAILVGDGMQALAIDLLLSHLPTLLPPAQVLVITHELVKASGPAGMVSGQSLDLSELSHAAVTETQLAKIHHLKTGTLIMACINMVLAAGQPSPLAAKALGEFASHLGLAFQMQDDYLDKYGALDTLGKGRASDEANQKTTFATLYQQEELAQLINDHFLKMHEALSLFDEKADDLRNYIASLHERSL